MEEQIPQGVDRRTFVVHSLTDPSSDAAYWRARTTAERFEMVEYLRQVNYGQAATAARLQRILEVAQLASG